MKIAFVNNTLRDTLNFRGNVIKAFLDKGYDLTIISPSDNDIQR